MMRGESSSRDNAKAVRGRKKCMQRKERSVIIIIIMKEWNGKEWNEWMDDLLCLGTEKLESF